MPDLSADRPYTDEDVALVARAIGADYWLPADRSAAARDVLAALAASGRLPPQGSEQWQVRITDIPTGHVNTWGPENRILDEAALRYLVSAYTDDPQYRVQFRKRVLGPWVEEQPETNGRERSQ
ncbi:hypothetical protein Drose_04315 [Dactylosporangium roseum]|uniref:Uncharacterized protein n=1 Tax=Dactylosporangium roseum TaxID=47989 RepID=A0ABY5ZAW9_9ACTN|nr:hypothetical protein [Dactylosporangium roseum]UWZ37514.1 hypothetical protein Drose_04315 [Dactylosporangium roseum]